MRQRTNEGATISLDRKHRYELWRTVPPATPAESLAAVTGQDENRGKVLWVMLNPSTADEANDDLTVKKCIGFTKRWGFGGVVVVNLFSYRATNPKDLFRWAEEWSGIGSDPINEASILLAATGCDRVIVAWGAQNGAHFNAAVRRTVDILEASGSSSGIACRRLFCLGTTKDGHPRHPSRIAYATELVAYDHSQAGS